MSIRRAGIVIGARGVGRNKADVGSVLRTVRHTEGDGVNIRVSRIIYSFVASYSDRCLRAHVLLKHCLLIASKYISPFRCNAHAKPSLISNEIQAHVFRRASNLHTYICTSNHLQRQKSLYIVRRISVQG